MKVLIFNGTIDNASNTSNLIVEYLKVHLERIGSEVKVFNLSDYDIPFFNNDLEKIPKSVFNMLELFGNCDRHIWLTPLYHGGIVGAMKNCLDWLILTANEEAPYLSNKIIGLICWGFGGNAATGVDGMRTIVSTLRAWTLPYSIPIVRENLFENENKKFSIIYEERFQRLNELLIQGNPQNNLTV